jgi:hypothetical protein
MRMPDCQIVPTFHGVARIGPEALVSEVSEVSDLLLRGSTDFLPS